MMHTYSEYALNKLLDPNLPDLQFDLEKLLKYQNIQLRNICNFWGKHNSVEIDKHSIDFITGLDPVKVKTSGSSAASFEYNIWHPSFHPIEIKLHYNYVLKEFDLDKKKICILKITPYNSQYDLKEITWKKYKFWIRSFIPHETDIFYSHGSKQATCFHLLYNNNEIEPFCEFLLDFLSKNTIDVFLTSFSFVSILLSCMQKPQKICTLLSNVCEAPLQKEVEFILKENICDYFCDHMRCWDGGFTFMTCKYGVRHIFDYLTYTEAIEERLICTDFFNYSMPFIKYWNGDFIKLDETWKKCECGRYYRDFQFGSSRKSFYFGKENKMSSIDLHDIIFDLNETAQALCYENKVVIITTKELSISDKSFLTKKIPAKVEFEINNFKFTGRYNKMAKIVDLTN
jgi:hypothetical protein